MRMQPPCTPPIRGRCLLDPTRGPATSPPPDPCGLVNNLPSRLIAVNIWKKGIKVFFFPSCAFSPKSSSEIQIFIMFLIAHQFLWTFKNKEVFTKNKVFIRALKNTFVTFSEIGKRFFFFLFGGYPTKSSCYLKLFFKIVFTSRDAQIKYTLFSLLFHAP